MSVMNSRFDGTCLCGATVRAGEVISYESRRVVGCAACAPTLAIPTQVVLVAKIQAVLWAKPDNSFAIAKAKCMEEPPPGAPVDKKGVFALKGRLGEAIAGDIVEIHGTWQNESKYGWALRAASILRRAPTDNYGLIRFLSAFPHVGKERARAILDHFGDLDRVLHVIEHDPVQLTAIAGITEKRALEIQAKYKNFGALKGAMQFLATTELGPRESQEVLDAYQEETEAIVRGDPYKSLRPFTSFQTSDRIAQRLGLARDDTRRLREIAWYALGRAEDDGHTYSTVQDLLDLNT